MSGYSASLRSFGRRPTHSSARALDTDSDSDGDATSVERANRSLSSARQAAASRPTPWKDAGRDEGSAPPSGRFKAATQAVKAISSFSSSMNRMATKEEIVGGAGAFVEQQNGKFLVLGLAPGGPAHASGQIAIGDRLVAIDNFAIWCVLISFLIFMVLLLLFSVLLHKLFNRFLSVYMRVCAGMRGCVCTCVSIVCKCVRKFG